MSGKNIDTVLSQLAKQYTIEEEAKKHAIEMMPGGSLFVGPVTQEDIRHYEVARKAYSLVKSCEASAEEESKFDLTYTGIRTIQFQ